VASHCRAGSANHLRCRTQRQRLRLQDESLHLVEALVLKEAELGVHRLGCGCGCAIRYRHCVLEAGNLKRQRIHLALADDGAFVIDVVVLVESLLCARDLTEVLVVVSVLDIDNLTATQVWERHAVGFIFKLRHPHPLDGDAVTRQHLNGDATILEELERRVGERTGAMLGFEVQLFVGHGGGVVLALNQTA